MPATQPHTQTQTYEPVPRTSAVAMLRGATEEVAKAYTPASPARSEARRAEAPKAAESEPAPSAVRRVVRGEFVSNSAEAGQRSAAEEAKRDYGSSSPAQSRAQERASLTPHTLPPTVGSHAAHRPDLDAKASPAALDSLRAGNAAFSFADRSSTPLSNGHELEGSRAPRAGVQVRKAGRTGPGRASRANQMGVCWCRRQRCRLLIASRLLHRAVFSGRLCARRRGGHTRRLSVASPCGHAEHAP